MLSLIMNSDFVEKHGGVRFFKCLGCDQEWLEESDDALDKSAMDCPACNTPTSPDYVELFPIEAGLQYLH